jgi:hypothetical protein
MPRPRRYADAAAKQAAYRRRMQLQASVTARFIALQEDYAQTHVVGGRVLSLQKQATAEQLTLQAAAKERDRGLAKNNVKFPLDAGHSCILRPADRLKECFGRKHSLPPLPQSL